MEVSPDIHIVKANENAFIVYFAQDISAQTFRLVRIFCHRLKQQKTHHFTQITPAYNNVLVSFKKQTLSDSTMIDFLHLSAQHCTDQEADAELNETIKTHRLPAYYHPEVGMDIDKVLKEKSLDSLESLLSLHSSKTYTVYAVGFCPGFAYLAEVDKRLQIARHQNPRLTVPKGSIAVAETQTAVYPIATPGGWHIIANCPTSLTPKPHNLNALWQIADQVIFEPINRQMYQKLGGEFDAGI